MNASNLRAAILAHFCPRCHAPAGAPCRDYRGRNKATCTERIPPLGRKVRHARRMGARDLRQGNLFSDNGGA